MNQLYEGLTLMLVGMTTVFVFLSLLVLVLTVSSKIILKYWPDDLSGESTKPSPNFSNAEPLQADQQRLTAIISAAIHQYRNSNKD